MRSKSNDFFSTLLVLIPLVAVPMLAIFGIPEIAPVKKSALNENDPFDGEKSSHSQFEEISFDASSHEIELGGEGNLGGPSRGNRKRSPQGSPFAKTSSSRNGSINGEEWLPPADAMEGWELDPVPSQLEPDQKMAELPSAEQMPERGFQNNPIEQVGFEDEQFSPNTGGAFGQEIQQIENETNPFDKTNSVKQAAVKEVDPQFRLRAETMLRRDPATWSAAVQKLNELGIRDYRLEPGVRPNEFLFSCSYSPPNNPRISRRFEAEALDPLKAVIKVLQQVDEWNQAK
ncbi:hypothetical protein [Gimesia fumaroli]|jgi:hypothetical protein|uniref:Uncharacterized protein n=1 Tax=Gimesia fumaroli TaxID=2527976 RepID=A0A518I6Q5_9PLAN|nr:hypothetical protein [Gimesia fumaroli]QDV48764.1 hypothetical protein Enr17x_07780 [Gimesia fumaroli]